MSAPPLATTRPWSLVTEKRLLKLLAVQAAQGDPQSAEALIRLSRSKRAEKALRRAERLTAKGSTKAA